MSNHLVAILTIALLPFVAALSTPIKDKSRHLFYIISMAAPLLNLIIVLMTGVVDSPVVLPLMPCIVFSLDKFSYIFALLINLAWLITVIYSISYVRHNFVAKKKKFYFLLVLATGTSLATGLSGNILTLLIFYMFNIPLIYPLILLRGSSRSKWAAKVYAGATFIPGVMLILPLIWFFGDYLVIPFQDLSIETIGLTHFQASLFLFALIAGLSKTCVAPFHFWLPLTSCAPAPVSGLIHTVGAVQTACIGIFKIAYYIYGSSYLEELSSNIFHTGWLIYLCGATAVYTAYRAYKTTDLKERFSNSTVGQLSYIISSILIGSKPAFLAAILHMVTHSIAKMNLFLIAGTFASVFNTVKTPEIARFAPHARPLVLATAISGLSIAGFPLLVGHMSKDLMISADLQHHHYSAMFFLLLGSLLNYLYIFPVIKAGIIGKKIDGFSPQPIPLTMKLSIGFCTLLLLAASYFADSLMMWVESL